VDQSADLLRVRTENFQLGAENLRQKLALEEMVDVPLERLLQVGFGESAPQSGAEFQRGQS